MTKQAPPMRVQSDDPQYRAQAAAEAEFWARPQYFGVEANAARRPGVLERYINERLTGDAGTHWTQAVARYGPFRRGMILGASGVRQEAHILESNADTQFVFADISPGALAVRERELGRRFPERMTTQELDLNFAELSADQYDVIVSSSTLHHVTNLEFAAFQINRALRPEGYLFVQDYTAEARHKLSPEKKALFEAIHARQARRIGQPDLRLEWTDEDETTLSPFCGVHSDEILPVLREYLIEEQLRTADAVLMPLAYCHPASRRARPHERIGHLLRQSGHVRRRLVADITRQPRVPPIAPAFMQDLLTIDPILCDAGILAPASSFAIYRKRA